MSPSCPDLRQGLFDRPGLPVPPLLDAASDRRVELLAVFVVQVVDLDRGHELEDRPVRQDRSVRRA